MLHLAVEFLNTLVDLDEVIKAAIISHEECVKYVERCLSFQTAFQSKWPQHHILHVIGKRLLLGKPKLQLVDSLLEGGVARTRFMCLKDCEALLKLVKNFRVVQECRLQMCKNKLKFHVQICHLAC